MIRVKIISRKVLELSVIDIMNKLGEVSIRVIVDKLNEKYPNFYAEGYDKDVDAKVMGIMFDMGNNAVYNNNGEFQVAIVNSVIDEMSKYGLAVVKHVETLYGLGITVHQLQKDAMNE